MEFPGEGKTGCFISHQPLWFSFSPGLNLVESFQTETSGPVLSTDKWLEYRDQVAPSTTTFPVRWPAASQVTTERDDIWY